MAQYDDCDEHERVLLERICRTTDIIDELQKVIDTEGPFADSPQGRRAHPALVEMRAQQELLAKLLRLARLDFGEAPPAPASRSGRPGSRRCGRPDMRCRLAEPPPVVERAELKGFDLPVPHGGAWSRDGEGELRCHEHGLTVAEH